jgi:hypothetical protein
MPVLNDKIGQPTIRRLLKWMGLLIGVGVLFLSLSKDLSAQDLPAREYQIKAVFLYNFTQFVQWPESAFSETASPLVIGILGEDPFGSYLDETVKGEVVNNHPLVIRRYEKLEDAKGCHVLFIGDDNKEDIRRTLQSLRTQPVLTVGDFDGFARMGGMVRFLTEKGRIRLRINVDAATEANLVISSKLLRLADITTQKNN